MGAIVYHAANSVSTENFKNPHIYILVVRREGITCDRYKPNTSFADNNATLLSPRKATFYFRFN